MEAGACYVTAAIPYVNAAPHVGFAFELLLADALARWRRLQGRDVRFQTGADENSLSNVRAAEAEGIATAALVARNSARFAALREVLELASDDFIRTSAEARHRAGVSKLWNACARRGDVYRRAYRGLYCVGCEQFYAPEELAAGLCPEHRSPPDRVAEENYFFRLSRYAEPLAERIESGRLEIVPAHRATEVLRFIRSGLRDLSISRCAERARGWGLPVPGDPEQVIYVWFDALGNYVTALDYAAEGPLYARYWRGSAERLHVIGKGIARFHAVYWPAILLSAGLPLPTRILVHGYLTAAGRKIGKSLGNSVDPVELVARYGADAVRYYLLRHFRATEDGDFALERLERAYTAELADQLGNLLHRTVSMTLRYADGAVPAAGPLGPEDRRLIAAARAARAGVERGLERLRPNEALAAVWTLVAAANQHAEETAPWAAARESGAPARLRLHTTLYNLAESLRLIALYAAPFIPGAARRIVGRIGARASADWDAAAAWGGLRPGTRVEPGPVLFPRLP